MPEIIRCVSSHPDFVRLTACLDEDLRLRNGVQAQLGYEQYNLVCTDTAVLAVESGTPVGCGCFRQENGSAEIKRMYVIPEYRGRGISKKILNELEAWAAELGFSYVVLETGRRQTEAIGLYERSGYEKTENYGPYAGMPDSLCFRKRIAKQPSAQ